MPTRLPHTLSCSVFGHNFKRSETESQIVCTCCNYKMHIDQKGDFETEPTLNREVQKTMRKLFLLSRLKKRLTLSH